MLRPSGGREDDAACAIGSLRRGERVLTLTLPLHNWSLTYAYTLQPDPLAYDAMARHPMVWCGMAWYGMVWCGMVWYGMVWHGMVCDVVWCDVMWCGVM